MSRPTVKVLVKLAFEVATAVEHVEEGCKLLKTSWRSKSA